MRYDAGIGICLLGDGAGQFKSISNTESGFFAPHDARCMIVANGNKSTLLVANNQEEIQSFRFNYEEVVQ